MQLILLHNRRPCARNANFDKISPRIGKRRPHHEVHGDVRGEVDAHSDRDENGADRHRVQVELPDGDVADLKLLR